MLDSKANLKRRKRGVEMLGLLAAVSRISISELLLELIRRVFGKRIEKADLCLCIGS